MDWAGKNFEGLYQRQDLEYWQTRYPENVRLNFTDLLLDRLEPAEHAILQTVRLEFPLVGVVGTPLDFYTNQRRAIVALPILSIKFIDDLSVAASWLEVAGFSQETVMDYVAMLKYSSPQRHSGARFPAPLDALQVPEKIWKKDKRVDDLSQKILKSALVWILAHELGHVRFSHIGYRGLSAQQAQQNELDADSFATDMFRRIGVPPVGMGLLFVLFAHFFPNRGDFASDSAWAEYTTRETTHPLSAVRLNALARGLGSSPEAFAAAEPHKQAASQHVRNIAQKLEEVGRLLGDSGLQRLMRARGITVTAESLAPRRPGELAGWGMKQFKVAPGTPVFHGLYTGTHTRRLANGGEESLDCLTLISRDGAAVTGRFSFGVGEGNLSGRVVERDLQFDWDWGDARGKGVLSPATDADFSGTWGYDVSSNNGGTWNGFREV